LICWAQVLELLHVQMLLFFFRVENLITSPQI
jgi:hypothetical protein